MTVSVPKEVWPALAAVTAALIAAVVSFLVAVLTKEQKTSEFRQTWIDALREDLAAFGGGAILIVQLVASRMRHGESLVEIEGTFNKTDAPQFKDIETVRLRLLFRLNPSEHKTLIAAIDALYKQSPQEHLKGPERASGLLDTFEIEARTVLKSEWERVKRGEPIFQAVKWGALILAAILGIVVIYLLRSI